MSLAGYADVFQNVVVGVPGKIGELRDRNGTYVVNSYSRIIGTRFDEMYLKKRFLASPLRLTSWLSPEETVTAAGRRNNKGRTTDEPMPGLCLATLPN